jgi:hypothetical protein
VNPETAEYLDKAHRCLAGAKTIAAAGLPDVAAREAYLAVYHAAEAYIFERTDKAAKTHRGVRRIPDLSRRSLRIPALHHGLHVPRAPRRGDLPVQGPALAKAGDGMLPSDFFRRNVVLSFQEDAIGIRLRDVIGPDNMMWDNMMWGSDYPHSESTFPQSRKILAEILAGVPDDEQAKPAPDRDPGIAGGNTARVYHFDVARLTVPR